MLRARAAAAAAARGRPPGLLLIAPETARGFAPHVERKRRALADAGVAERTVLLPLDAQTSDLSAAIRSGSADPEIDAIFVQYPLPPGVDEAAACRHIPAAHDIDLMNPDVFEQFLKDPAAAPPVTASALLDLLDGYDVDVAGLTAVVVAAPFPLAVAFRLVLDRRNAAGPPPLALDDARLDRHLATADLVVVALATPGAVTVERIPAGVIAIDAGYFNPGGRGDIDAAGGTAHLRAFAPVPGGIGPMTVSALVEATIIRAGG
jgi:methylenetetrahydrofolate dehydrogenase (NADP+) / methenyltetrahydrofolate cyclohydrolase